MAEESLKVEIIKREIIKPSSPTPSHLKTFKLSLIDQLQPVVYGPVLLFYDKNDLITSDQRSQRLKASLAETLARFYPVAGQINRSLTIECSDEGAPFVEARCHGLLSALISQQADPDSLRRFLPAEIMSQEAGTRPLLVVQETRFACGGLALGVCLSHKFADATTLGIFMKCWAEQSNRTSPETASPVFGAADYFPPRDFPVESPALELKKTVRIRCVSKRFVFQGDKMACLKEKTGLRNPSRVEAVTALIWRCAMNAAGPLSRKKFVVTQAVNLRRRAKPPFPDNLAGNLIGNFRAETDEVEPELSTLAALLRKGLTEYGEKKGTRLRGDQACEVVSESMREVAELFVRDDISVMIFTSLCNFGLYEGVDFGWGRPVWITIPPVGGHRNVVILMDSGGGGGGGGVEAWVTLGQEEMALFENDSLLLEFASSSTWPSLAFRRPCAKI